MPIRFSAAECLVQGRLDASNARAALGCVANDNGSGEVFDQTLKAALRHFGVHGMGAADDARSRAEAAFFAGDRDSYRWWLNICRLIDKRTARQAEQIELVRSETLPAS